MNSSKTNITHAQNNIATISPHHSCVNTQLIAANAPSRNTLTRRQMRNKTGISRRRDEPFR